MNKFLPTDQCNRAHFLLDLAWEVFFERIASGKIKINKESSMQLHYATILHSLGEAFCITPTESFNIELESARGKQNIDITCSLGETKIAIELKCFRKASNRAVDIDMYDVLIDVARLLSFKEYNVRRFICLTDNKYYSETDHSGHAGSVSIRDGIHYIKGTELTPSWSGKWKNKSKDKPIHIESDLKFMWVRKDGWYALSLNL